MQHNEACYYGDELVAAIEKGKRWIKKAQGQFSAFVFAKECDLSLELRDQILEELVEQKIIVRDEKRNGLYHRIDTDLVPMDWMNATVEPYPLWLPLDLNQKAVISPGNVIVLAGETNAGKTVLALKTAYHNLIPQGGAHSSIKYFNSEMHPAELRGRLLSIDQNPQAWAGLEPYSRTRDFDLVIDPNGLNIIDYLENLDDFWLVGRKIEKIHNALESGVAIICLQKKKDNDLAYGADFTLQKARLGLSLFFDGHANYLRITKCKFPATYPNPQGQEIDFTIQAGAELVPVPECGWNWVSKDQRAARTRSREAEARLKNLGHKDNGYE
jgi:hypothetical protein